MAVQPFHRHGEIRAVDPVLICLTADTVPRMKIRRHLLRLADSDVLWQSSVECIGYFICRNRAVHIEDSNISHGMYARVRAAGADHLNLFPRKIRKASVQDAFYRLSIRLYLPPVIIGPIIGDG